MDHHELIDALESAEAGSPALDRQIAKLFGWHRVEPRHASNKHGGWISPDDFCGTMSDGSPIYDGTHGTTLHRDPPRFTGSVDDALSLVPEGYGAISANISERGPSSMRISHPYTFGNAATPALALCIAILKATDHHTTGGRG